MAYAVTGLPLEAFQPLFGLTDAELAERNIVRVTAADDGFYPCRVTLEDVRPGQTLLLLNYEHQPKPSPYQSRHAIFVSEAARAQAVLHDQMPAQLATRKLMSLRAYDEAGMITDAAIVPGPEVEDECLRMLADPAVTHIDAHNPARGCFAARIVRN